MTSIGPREESYQPYRAIARRFKVSALVAARRVLDLDLINREAFFAFYGAYQDDEHRHNADWEKLPIFLNFRVPKLPAPKEEDLSKGILEVIDMDSRLPAVGEVERKTARREQNAGALGPSGRCVKC